MTPAERKAVKAGKHERIRKLLETLRPAQPKPMFDEQLMMLLAMQKEKK